jgi:hypothetical protein
MYGLLRGGMEELEHLQLLPDFGRKFRRGYAGDILSHGCTRDELDHRVP